MNQLAMITLKGVTIRLTETDKEYKVTEELPYGDVQHIFSKQSQGAEQKAISQYNKSKNQLQ